MSNANYFKVGTLDIEYPIFLKVNGKNWNFYRDYGKKLSELEADKDVSHKLFDMAIDLNVFDGITIHSNVPFLVTNDIRSGNDKRKYYVVDYLIPEVNRAVILTTNKNKNRINNMKTTLTNMGLKIIEVNELENMPSPGEYLTSLSTTLRFITENPMTYPKYFE